MDSSICGDNEVCIPNYQDNSVRCVCEVGYTGTPCSKFKHKKISLCHKLSVTSNSVITKNLDPISPSVLKVLYATGR